MSDLCWCLAPLKRAHAAIPLILYAIIAVTREYQSIRPYGPVEPLVGLFAAANRLLVYGRRDAALLAVGVLAWCHAHTGQLAGGRSARADRNLAPELRHHFLQSLRHAKARRDWRPGSIREDPWASWP